MKTKKRKTKKNSMFYILQQKNLYKSYQPGKKKKDCLNTSTLPRYSTLIPHDEEPNLSILSPKSLCRDKSINYMKFGDVCIGKTRSLYP